MAIRTVKPLTGIKGMDVVLRNLAREIENIKNNSTKGLIEASIYVRRDMDKTPPLIPVDTGNLRASWFWVTAKSQISASANFKGKDAGRLKSDYGSAISSGKVRATAINMPIVIFGFSANYAMWVHENVGANFAGQTKKIKYTRSGKVTASTRKYTRRSGAGAKFLEASLKRNKNQILKIIRDNARIK